MISPFLYFTLATILTLVAAVPVVIEVPSLGAFVLSVESRNARRRSELTFPPLSFPPTSLDNDLSERLPDLEYCQQVTIVSAESRGRYTKRRC